MRDYREVTESLFKRREIYLAKKKKRQRMFYYAITSLCVIMVLTFGVYLPQKPQEAIVPHSSFQNSSSVSSENSCVNSNCSQVISSSHQHGNVTSSLPHFQNTVSSFPQVQQQTGNVTSIPSIPSIPGTSTIPEASFPTPPTSTPLPSAPSIPPVSSVPEVSLPKPPSSPSKPPIDYKLDFSNLEQFSAFLPQLDIQIDSSKVVDTTIPEITTPEPNKNFWGYSPDEDLGAPPEEEKPNAFPTGPSSPESPSDEAIWNDAKKMFENGYYSVPYLQNGNEQLYLSKIYIQKDTIKYNYRFRSGIHNTSNNDLLSVQLYDYSIESTISKYYKQYEYRVLNYNGISYTAFRMDGDNMYDACIIWQQNGFWCRANYRGNDMYLSSIIPNLYLIQLPWTES